LKVNKLLYISLHRLSLFPIERSLHSAHLPFLGFFEYHFHSRAVLSVTGRELESFGLNPRE
jgi:hypothetical protein